MTHQTPIDLLSAGKRKLAPVKGYQALYSIAGTSQSLPTGYTLDAEIELRELGWIPVPDSGAWKPSEKVIRRVQRNHRLRKAVTDEINNFWPPDARLTRADLLLQACVTQVVLDRHEEDE